MNRWHRGLWIAVVAVSMGGTAWAEGPALSPSETDPRKIMETVEGRDLGDKVHSAFSMSIKDGQGRERTRAGVVRTLAHDGGRKGLILFESPAEIRNTGLLTFDWDDRAKVDDQWLYMPALNRTTRITGAGKSGSFIGSDLTFADMTRRNPSDYSYAMVDAAAKVDGEDAWLIEATPTSDREKEETGYSKAQMWISKSKLVPLQISATLAKGGKVKRMKFFDIRQVDGIWTAHKLVIRTDKGDALQSMTVMSWTSFAYNRPDITPEVMTTQRLEQGL